MKKTVASGLKRLVAFLLIATAFISVIGFSAGGWQSMTNTDSNSDNTVQNSGNVDEDKTYPEQNLTPPTVKFYDYLTGKEVSEEQARIRKAAFLINTDMPLYGVSSGELAIEFPTENGSTRLLTYTSCINSLGKIGAIAPTRDYISNMILSFGGILVANGNDSTVEYGTADVSKSFFDLSASPGYSYTEYTHFVYSNHDLIKAGLSNCGFSTTANSFGQLPYLIYTGDDYVLLTGKSAKNVTLSFSDATTEFYFSREDGKYYFYKNGVQKFDMLYDKAIAYDNLFVLFADSVTYESEDGTELVMDTAADGKGYYVRDGAAKEIFWKSTSSGGMIFTDSEGKMLTVGKGTTYIGFMKSSARGSLILN